MSVSCVVFLNLAQKFRAVWYDLSFWHKERKTVFALPCIPPGPFPDMLPFPLFCPAKRKQKVVQCFDLIEGLDKANVAPFCTTLRRQQLDNIWKQWETAQHWFPVWKRKWWRHISFLLHIFCESRTVNFLLVLWDVFGSLGLDKFLNPLLMQVSANRILAKWRNLWDRCVWPLLVFPHFWDTILHKGIEVHSSGFAGSWKKHHNLVAFGRTPRLPIRYW